MSKAKSSKKLVDLKRARANLKHDMPLQKIRESAWTTAYDAIEQLQERLLEAEERLAALEESQTKST